MRLTEPTGGGASSGDNHRCDSRCVDVVMTTMNRLELTREAVRSVQAQTVTTWHLWLVDDGSTDGSAEQLRTDFRDDPRVRVLLEPHRGTVGSRGVAEWLGSAPWVAFLDSDDLWLPQKLTKQLALVRDDIDVVLCWDNTLLPNGRRTKGGRPRGAGTVSPLFTSNMSIPLVRRRLLESTGGCGSQPGLTNLSTCEVTEFYLRLLPPASVDVVRDVLVLCRTHSGMRNSDDIATLKGAAEMDEMLRHHAWLAQDWPREYAQLLAGTGARYIAGGRWAPGLHRLRQAVDGARARDRACLLAGYAPFLANQAFLLARAESARRSKGLSRRRRDN
jgi:Glycosyl transferase family 2